MAIGFASFQKAWEGPVYLEMGKFSEHSKVVRYKCHFQTRVFDLYAPRFMLDALAPNGTPKEIVVAIGKVPERLRQIGFSAAPYQPEVSSELCEFSLSVLKVHSIRYDLLYDGQTYALYVPNEIFGDEPHPKSVYLRIGIPPGGGKD